MSLHRLCILAVVVTATGLLSGQGAEAVWSVPNVQLRPRGNSPAVACTAEELGRLKAAYAQPGPAHDCLSEVIRKADKALAKPLVFPPRGGQHNQWYQCEKCQLGLKTVDATHHRCPKCKEVYSGAPYDDVLYGHVHGGNLAGARDAAWAYAITGKRAYAEHAAKVLLGYAERYLKYPLHSSKWPPTGTPSASAAHINEQTLGEASYLAEDVAPAFDLIYETLAEKDRAAIRDGLILPMLQTIDRYKAKKSNWQTWHNAALLWGGAVIGQESWVRKAIGDPENGFAFQMNASVSAEGMWYENSWGYHFYTLHAMVTIAEGSRRLGVDVWSHPTLRKMFTLAPRYAMADGSLPRYGDDVRTRANSGGTLLEAAWHATHDPIIAAQLSAKPNWDSVLLGRVPEPHATKAPSVSEVFPGAGHAILRTEGAGGLTAALTFGPYGGSHGHYDKLSFVFFGYGQELGVDPGRAASQAYRLPVHKHWYKATLGHNAVLVDQVSQQPATGKLEYSGATNDCAAVLASCDEAYPGVKNRRLLVLRPGFLLVVDELQSEKPRRFDWLYHHRGSQAVCPQATQAEKLPEKFLGGEFIANSMSGACDDVLRVEFPSKQTTTYLTMAAEPGSKVLIGDGVGQSVMDRVPLTMVTRQGKQALFAAALEPVPAGGKACITSVATQRVGEEIRITVQWGSAQEAFVLGPGGKVQVQTPSR